MVDSRRPPTQMWRPEKTIKAKVLGLIWRGNSFLACKVYADNGQIIGIRPPGGSVAFGETREQAIIRECKEELGVEVRPRGNWHTFENLFEHEGETGHEYVFVSALELSSSALLKSETIEIIEDRGGLSIAEWFSRQRIEAENIEVFPPGLREILFDASC